MAKRRSRSGSSPRRPALRSAARPGRTFDALPDTLDFRDRMYTPTLVEVPSTISLESYRAAERADSRPGHGGRVHGLRPGDRRQLPAARAEAVPDTETVSPRMLYEMAKRYDEWPGEDYDGLERARRHEGLAQARRLRRGGLARTRPVPRMTRPIAG